MCTSSGRGRESRARILSNFIAKVEGTPCQRKSHEGKVAASGASIALCAMEQETSQLRPDGAIRLGWGVVSFDSWDFEWGK